MRVPLLPGEDGEHTRSTERRRGFKLTRETQREKRGDKTMTGSQSQLQFCQCVCARVGVIVFSFLPCVFFLVVLFFVLFF